MHIFLADIGEAAMLVLEHARPLRPLNRTLGMPTRRPRSIPATKHRTCNPSTFFIVTDVTLLLLLVRKRLA